MHLIAYLSTARAPETIDATLDDIIAKAKAENAKRGITGVLFYRDGQFLQVIEGSEPVLRQLMARIESDPRHADIQYLVDTPVETRGFSQWTMDSFVLDDGRVFDAGTLKALTTSFLATLVPRSDTLILYYKVLLAQRTR